MESQGIHLLRLPRNVLFEIMSHLDYKQLSRLGACCTELRELCMDDLLWKNLCKDCWDENYLIEKGTWKEAFINEFEDKWRYMSFYKVVRKAWLTIKSVLNALDPEIVSSLNPGKTEQELDKWEELYKVKIPDDVRCIYRFHDGQIPNGENGLFGNVKVYEYSRTEYFFPMIQDSSYEASVLLVAGFNHTRIHCLLQDRPPLKAGNLVTYSLPKKNSYLVLANRFLDYFLDYAQKLKDNYFPILEDNRIYRFYTDPSWVSRSHGVTIKVSTAYLHELDRDQFVFAYHIRFEMDKNESDDASCRLETRRWVIREGPKTHTVEGRGVIGLTPLFTPGTIFRYTSCVKSAVTNPSMGGHFVVRNIRSGETYQLTVPDFQMDAGRIVPVPGVW